MTIGVAAAALLAAPPAAAQATPPPGTDTVRTAKSLGVEARARRLFVRGMTEAQLGNHDAAIARYEEALDRAPGAPAVLSALAAAHEAAGDRTTALFYARRARDAAPGTPAYAAELAALQRRAGRLEAAITTYERLLDAFPDRTSDRVALARVHAEAERPEAALEAYEAAVEPLVGQFDGLGAGMDAPLRLGPAGPPLAVVLRDMLDLYRSTGDSAGAERTLERLVALRPSAPSLLRQLGSLYVARGRPEAAVPVYERLRAAQAGSADATRRLAQAYRAADRPGAADSLEASSDGPPGSAPDPNRVVARIRSSVAPDLEALGPLPPTADTAAASDLSEPIRQLRQALDGASDRGTARRLLGLLLYRAGRYDEAAPLLEAAVDANPRQVALWSRAASAHLRAGRPGAAVTLAKEGLLLFPGRRALVRVLARALVADGRPRQALERARQGLEALPDEGPSAERAALEVVRGDAHQALGNASAAREAWQRSLEADPDQPAVTERLERSSE